MERLHDFPQELHLQISLRQTSEILTLFESCDMVSGEIIQVIPVIIS